jgi:hypothetical protein
MLSANGSLAAFSLVVLVAGYLVVAALFYGMVYRPRKQEKEKEAERKTDEQEPGED